MEQNFNIKEFLRQTDEQEEFHDLDESELIDLLQSQAMQSPIILSPSLVSSSASSSTSSSLSLINFSPSFHGLLPPDCYHPLPVIASTGNTTSATYTSPQSNSAFPLTQTQTQSDIDTIANTLFQDIKENVYNDTEFLDFLQEWHNESKETGGVENQTDLPLAKRQKKS